MGGGLWVVPVYAQLPSADQRKVFRTPASGTTKVVLATDICESSITIPDVTLVIDTGLHRAASTDPITGASHLKTSRVSLAAAAQRRGRAGRVSAGMCYHLYCRIETEVMERAPAPEMVQIPLDGICLRACRLFPSTQPLQTLLAGALSPPDPTRLTRAVALLERIGALASGGGGGCGDLTPLGRRLSGLGVDPRSDARARHATAPRRITPCHATPRHATPRHAAPRHATPRRITTPHPTPPHHNTPHPTPPHHTTGLAAHCSTPRASAA